MSDKETWTIMVYISADNVLANFAVESLKQLRRAAGDGVNVVAQFDANGKQEARRLLFPKDENADVAKGKETDALLETDVSLENNVFEKLSASLDMAASGTLTDFINRATAKHPADHYCLFLWGHGTELLLDINQSNQNKDGVPAKRYLTPANLKSALKATNLFGWEDPKAEAVKAEDQKVEAKGKRKLDILGLDACSMSMVELATELQGCVNFMVASQDDVPDASFPYEQILTRLKKSSRDDVRATSKMIPEAYKKAFQDYFPTPGPGVKELTLSSLNLDNIGSITTPLKSLAEALLPSPGDPYARKAIIAARIASRSFVQGIFVDLSDFCEQLLSTNAISEQLTKACTDLRTAITDNSENACVIENKTDKDKNRAHGVSIYFPYFDNEDDEQIQDFLGDTQTDMVNHLSLLVKGGKDSLHKARIGRIEELEDDFQHLGDQFKGTEWLSFIQEGWSRILATELPPGELDRRYSAEQCTRNLLATHQSPLGGQEGVTVMPKSSEAPEGDLIRVSA
jgi:hypothetical protein